MSVARGKYVIERLPDAPEKWATWAIYPSRLSLLRPSTWYPQKYPFLSLPERCKTTYQTIFAFRHRANNRPQHARPNDQFMLSIARIRSNKMTALRTSSVTPPRAGSRTLNLCANGMNHLKDPGLLRQGYTMAHLCLLHLWWPQCKCFVIYKDAWMSNP